MQRSTTWIIKSLWGACERWSKSDCIDLSAAFAYYTLQSFFPILLISLSIASRCCFPTDNLLVKLLNLFFKPNLYSNNFASFSGFFNLFNSSVNATFSTAV